MISNYINHHQIPFSNALYEKEGVEYTFIQTEPMEEERIRMGWGLDPKSLPYVKLLYEEESACRQLIDECDMLLVGWMEHEDIIKDYISHKEEENRTGIENHKESTDDFDLLVKELEKTALTNTAKASGKQLCEILSLQAEFDAFYRPRTFDGS